MTNLHRERNPFFQVLGTFLLKIKDLVKVKVHPLLHLALSPAAAGAAGLEAALATEREKEGIVAIEATCLRVLTMT
jgi:hypothetical protein